MLINTINNGTEESILLIPMQKTGIPLVPFVVALIVIAGGFVSFRKKY